MALSRPLVDTKNRAPIVQSVQGVSGSGTTQYAVELAYRFGYFFKGVHWVDGSRPGAIGAEIAACGAAMGLSDWPDELPAQIDRTLREWSRPNLHLLILDNIDDVAAAQVWLDQLAIGALRLVITTVRDDWPADARLEGLTPEDSRSLLRAYVPERQASDADLDRLAERLRHMPLALDLAGRYLAQQPQLTVAGYSRKLARARKPMDGLLPASIESASALAVSLDLAEPAARRLFLAAGYCAPDQPIPAEILRRVAGLDEAECDRQLTGLIDLGLIAPAAPGVGPIIHPLAARFARSVAKTDAERGKRISAASGEGAAEATSILTGVADVLGVLTYQVTENDPEASHLFRPHLEAAALAADGAGLAQAGTLWNNLGYYRKTAGDLAGAREVFERALTLNVALYGRDHPNVARDLNNMGLVLHEQGELSGARTLIERALEIDRAAPGENSLTIAADLSNLAGVLQDQGEVEAARSAFEEALAVFEARLPADHPYVGIARDNLKALAS
ncbi:MAG: tetratricopeptide repeat protein [Anaerolineales bacterium]|nr:tetratricopeptide repeat protein [Anaerolineales bacterium]